MLSGRLYLCRTQLLSTEKYNNKVEIKRFLTIQDLCFPYTNFHNMSQKQRTDSSWASLTMLYIKSSINGTQHAGNDCGSTEGSDGNSAAKQIEPFRREYEIV